MLDLRLLGGFSLRVDDREADPPSTQKARALLAYLALARGRAVPRETLCEVFWPDADPERARGNLKTAIWSIRRVLAGAGLDADASLRTDRTGARWDAATEIDVERLYAAGDGSDAAARRAAIAGYRGDFLEGDYGDWAIAERERLAARYEALLAAELRDAGDPAIAERLLERDPYREEAYLALVRSALAAGNRRGAHALFRRAVAALAEIGERPSEELRALAASLEREEGKPPAEFVLPFVGRDEELRAVEEALDAGIAATIFVRGAAGIGKSSLLERVERAARERGLAVLHVRARPFERGTFGPWPEVVAAIAGMPFVEFARENAALTVAAIPEAIARAYPQRSVLVLDDAQALEGDALHVAREVARVFAERGGCTVAAYRPEGESRVRASLEAAHARTLALEPLAEQDVAAAVRRAAGAPLPELQRALLERTGGYPLFLLGLCSAYARSGALARGPDAWRFDPQRAAGAAMPDDVRDLYLQRLRERGEDPATLAATVALEPTLGADEAGRVLEWDEGRTLDAIDDLLALGILIEREHGPRLAFVHDVVREAAASAISRTRATATHRRIAVVLEDRAGAHATRASHYVRGGRPADAARAYAAAAREALAANALDDAERFAAAGLSAAELAPEADALAVGLLASGALAALEKGGQVEAAARADAAIERARRTGEARAGAIAFAARARVRLSAQDFREAERDAREAAAFARETGDASLVVGPQQTLSAALSYLGDREGATRSHDAAYAAAMESQMYVEAAVGALTAFRTAAQFLDIAGAALWLERIRELLERLPQSGAYEARYRESEAFLLQIVGDVEGAYATVLRALAEIERPDSGPVYARSPRVAVTVRYAASTICRIAGRFEEVVAYGAAIRASAWFAESPMLRRWCGADVVCALCALRRPAEAREWIGYAASEDDPQIDFESAMSHAYLACAEGRDASRALRAAFDDLRSREATYPGEVDYYFGEIARLARERGDRALADEAGERAGHFLSLRREAAGERWRGPAIQRESATRSG